MSAQNAKPGQPAPTEASRERAFIDALRKYWRYDDYQQPLSSWHEREDFIEKVLPKLLAAERERVVQQCAKAAGDHVREAGRPPREILDAIDGETFNVTDFCDAVASDLEAAIRALSPPPRRRRSASTASRRILACTTRGTVTARSAGFLKAQGRQRER